MHGNGGPKGSPCPNLRLRTGTTCGRAGRVLMRIAWIGPSPSNEGGVTYVATLLLLELARAGAEVDCYVGATPDGLPDVLLDDRRLAWSRTTWWRWHRWYSRKPFLAFASGAVARLQVHHALTRRIVTRHAERPYDVVYQFSQPSSAAYVATGRYSHLSWCIPRHTPPASWRGFGAKATWRDVRSRPSDAYAHVSRFQSGRPAPRSRARGSRDWRQSSFRRTSGGGLPAPSRATRCRCQPDRPRALPTRTTGLLTMVRSCCYSFPVSRCGRAWTSWLAFLIVSQTWRVRSRFSLLEAPRCGPHYRQLLGDLNPAIALWGPARSAWGGHAVPAGGHRAPAVQV